MCSTTLVLNADGRPVTSLPLSTIDWKDAIRVIYLNRASVLEEYDKWVVRSPSVQMRMPSVIMLSEYQTHNGKIEFSRFNMILRDNFKCQYCGDTFKPHELTYDHVIPRKEGGKTNWENIVMACDPCNGAKGHSVHIKPLRDPYKPSYWDLSASRKKLELIVPHESWIPYLGWEGDVRVNKNMKYENTDIFNGIL